MTESSVEAAETRFETIPTRLSSEAILAMSELTILSIETVELRAQRAPGVLIASVDFELNVSHEPQERLLRSRYTVRATLRDEHGSQVGEVFAAILLTTSWPIDVDAESAENFGRTSGAIMMHPYLREAVSGQALRMGVPGVYLPTLTLGPVT